MKLTEKEYLNSNEQLIFRLRNLMLNEKETFEQIKEYLPFPIYINSRSINSYRYFSKSFFSKGKEIEDLYQIGGSYLDKISNSVLLKNARDKAKLFAKQNDFNSICNYMQIIYLNKIPTAFFTNKILINDELTLNTTLFTSEFQLLDNFIKEFIPISLHNGDKWSLFKTLTKQEKKIIKLLIKGFNNADIGDILSISTHTVITHRKNIYRKLEVNSINELIQFASLLNFV